MITRKCPYLRSFCPEEFITDYTVQIVQHLGILLLLPCLFANRQLPVNEDIFI